MKIAICVMGSRGDVQPLVALGKGLQAEGHAVILATHQEFQPMVRQAGLWFHLLRGLDPKASMEKFTGEKPKSGLKESQFVQSIRMTKLLQSAIPEIGESCLEACSGADCCISNLIPPAVASSVAEKMGIPHMYALLQPIEPTGEFPHMLVTHRTFGPRVNALSYACVSYGLWGMVRSHVNRWRRSLSLPALSWRYFPEVFSGPMPRLYGFSPSVVPKPGEWSDQAAVTGYWFLNQAAGWSPPKPLVDFLEAGPPPIAIGFGSMVVSSADNITELCIEALSKANQRGILLTGWGGLHVDDLPKHVFVIESAPHEWLFPRIAAVVHHGGAGTTAAGLCAGVPTIIVPFITDQPFWGKRVHELGVGPKPIPRGKLTADRLAAAMTEAVTNQSIGQRATELGEKIRAEDGIAGAIDVIHQVMKDR